MSEGHQNVCLYIQILKRTDNLKSPPYSQTTDLMRFQAKNRPPLKIYFSTGGWIDARDEIEKSRLPCSVGTDDPEDFASLSSKTHPVQRAKAIEFFTERSHIQ
jgi:hypothetical protein